MDKKEIRKRKKGFFALLMALLFLFTSLPVDVLAASYETLEQNQVVLKGDTIYVYESGYSLKYVYDDGGVATEESAYAESDTNRYYHEVKNIQPSGAPYPYSLWSVKELDAVENLLAPGALRINTLTLTPVDSFLTIEGEIASTSGTKTTINWTITVNPNEYVWNGGVTVVNQISDAFTGFTEYSGEGITVSVSPESTGVTPTVTEAPSGNPGTGTPGTSPESEGVTPTAIAVKWKDLQKTETEWAYTISEFSIPTARRYVLNFTTVVDMADRSAAEDVESSASLELGLEDLGLEVKGTCKVPVPTHTVTFDANSHGTAPAKIENVAHGSKITAPTEPTEEGYTFGGWYKEDTCEDDWDFNEDTVTGDTTLYAKWTINTYTVTFDANGRGTAPAKIENVAHGSKITAPTAPSETGWTFGGWYKESGCTNAWNFNEDTVTGNTTLYAGWTPQTGSLSIAMNIADGYTSDKDTDFRYTVKLTNAEEGFAGTYGDLTFTDAEAAFTLKDGQSVTAANLPAGLTFTVEQKGNPFFATTSTGASGTVPADATASAAFVNTQKTSIAPKTQTLVADGDDGSVLVEGTDTLDGSFEYFYQWYKGKTNGEVIDGAGSETLNVPAGTEAGTTYYYCEILAKLGNVDEFTVTTDPAEVIVVEPVKPCFAGHSLVLSGTIGVNFYMDLPKAAQLDYSDSSMELTVQGVTTTIPLDANVPQVAQDSGKYYRFTCYVNSVQMADEITAVFHYRQKGEAAEVTDTYSVKRYVEASENMNFNEQTVALIRAIADYGHYAQPYLAAQNGWTVGEKHEEMDKYYAAYTEADVNKARADVADMGIKASRGKWIDKVSLSLTLESNTMLNIYFTPVSGYTGTPTATVDGQTAEVQTLEDGRFRLSIPNIEAYRLGNKYNIRLKTGSYVTTVQVSAMSFVKAVLDKTKTGVINDEVNAVVALYKYCKAVQAYR